MYVNVNRAIIKGFDANLDYKSDNINGFIGYSMISARERGTNTVLYTTQPRTLKTGLSYKFSNLKNYFSGIGGLFRAQKSSLVFGFRASFVDSFDYNTTNDVNELKSTFQTAKRPGYSTYDVYSQYNIGDELSFYLGVDNLTNKAYRRINTANFDMGRNYRIGVTIRM
jgi:outer membrane receptor protein involved in Fe transport